MAITPVRWSKDLPPLEGSPFNFAVKSMDEARKRASLTKNARWPGIRATAQSSGPTGVPWVDWNGWQVRMILAREPDKPAWVDVDPPQDALPVSYEAAVADAAVFGGRWIASAPRPEWTKVTKAAAFFNAHREWDAMAPAAVLAIVSDFTGPNEFLSGEVLNLLARRHLAYKVIHESRIGDLAGMKGVLYVSRQPAPKQLLDWAAQGGLLIAPFGTPAKGAAEDDDRWKIYSTGKGRLAVAKKQWSDPYSLAVDTHLLLGRKHDLIRMWNPGSLNTFYKTSADGSAGVVHLVNYAFRGAANEVTVGLSEKYSSVTMHTFEASTPLKPVLAGPGIEIQIPPLTVYAALELKK
jgi:hypothetical protein